MNKAVFGISKDFNEANDLVTRLQAAGFSTSDISILAPDTQGKHDFGHVKETKAPEGATTGATTGGIIGGVLGLLAGIGALAIPGVGPFIAAGPIMGALSGLGIGATTGGVVGGLIGLGIPEYEARLYEEKLKSGHYLISVHTEDGDEISRAKDLFKAAGAEDVAVTSEHDVDKDDRVAGSH
ncbi:MAG TPA: hypothetical protein VF585_01695 [Chthoniobacterales bacterium]|jgi:hypothetical protein